MGGGGVLQSTVHPPHPPFVSAPLSRCRFLPNPLNKVLTSFLFSLPIRFPQKPLPVCAEGQDGVAGVQKDPPPTPTSDMSVSIHTQSPDDIKHAQIRRR